MYQKGEAVVTEIDSYEKYCRSYTDDTNNVAKAEALLMLYIQNWIVKLQSNTEKEFTDYSLSRFIEDNFGKQKRDDSKADALSNIIDGAMDAFRIISKSMREKIIRENVMMPSYKVKEINSQGLNWLSRQSGRNIKQKVSSAGNNVLAVQRRMSYDTGENRLFVEFVRELLEQLTIKLKYVPETYLPAYEKDVCNELASFLYRDDIKEIRRWENFPPNNTLLSDQNYKKIWHAWNSLKTLDELILADSQKADERLATIFYYEFLTQIQGRVKIAQLPLEIDYDNYLIHYGSEKVSFIDSKDKAYCISVSGNVIKTVVGTREIYAEINEGRISIYAVGDDKGNSYAVNVGNIYKYTLLYASKIGLPKDSNPVEQIATSDKCDSVVIDLFALHPSYLIDDEELKSLEERVLQQTYDIEDIYGDKRKFYLPCDTTKAISMTHGVTKTYTISYAVDNESFDQLQRLMHMMEGYISAKQFSYVFPDAYNEFQLSKIYKAARMAYRNVSSMPMSVGVAFDYMATDDFAEYFEPDDFLLIVNLLDDELTLTLIKGEYDDNVACDIPDYKGVVWERHPTATVSVKNKISDRIIDCLEKAGCEKAQKLYQLFGLEGLISETEKLSVLFDDASWFTISEELSEALQNLVFNIDDEISSFFAKQQGIIGDAQVHILSLVENLTGKDNFIQFMDKRSALYGVSIYESLRYDTEKSLWHDHLPNLSIKLLYDKFDLIKDAIVLPVFEPQKIEIPNTFVLPKGENEYHFRLVQEDSARKLQYEAVVKNSKFPLNQDVECILDMVYHYGAEDPFTLIFRPIDPITAKFAEAKVEWKNFEEYEWRNNPVPAFPHKLSWEDLRTYAGRNNETIDVIKILTEKFELIGKGYETHDLTNEKIESNWKGQKCGEFYHTTNEGERVLVKWSEWDWEKGSQKPYYWDGISFLLEDSTDRPTVRYKIDDVWEARTRRDNVWFTNKQGSVMAILNFEYEGEDTTIAVMADKFDNPEEFDENLDSISFEVSRNKKTGQLSAVNIHNEDYGPYRPKKYKVAKRIHTAGTPPKHFVNSFYNRWMRVLFANNRSLAEDGCPDEFRYVFLKNQEKWLSLFHEYDDPKDKNKAFIDYSLAVTNIGKEYFPIAAEYLRLYFAGEIQLEYEFGCALGNMTTDMQKSFLKAMVDRIPEKRIMIGILAKALWHDEQFVYNIYDYDADLLLDYFDYAVEFIGTCLEDVEYDRVNRENLLDIRYCLEYILGILRLRALENETLNKKYLSLNNANLLKLYRYLEIMISNHTKLYSFLKLEITNKGGYDFIPDFMYAMLVYVSGYNTDSEIKISGINTEFSDDED